MDRLGRCFGIGFGGVMLSGTADVISNVYERKVAKLEFNSTIKSLFETAEQKANREAAASSYDTLGDVFEYGAYAILAATAFCIVFVATRRRKA